MNRTAIFPGSFDPITIGHEQLIRRALPLFDTITVVVGVNVRKQCRFTLEQRMEWIRRTFADCKQVTVDSCDQLTVDYCRQHHIGYLLRLFKTHAYRFIADYIGISSYYFGSARSERAEDSETLGG